MRPSFGTASERPDDAMSASSWVCSSSSTGRLLVLSDLVRLPPGPRSFLSRRFRAVVLIFMILRILFAHGQTCLVRLAACAPPRRSPERRYGAAVHGRAF